MPEIQWIERPSNVHGGKFAEASFSNLILKIVERYQLKGGRNQEPRFVWCVCDSDGMQRLTGSENDFEEAKYQAEEMSEKVIDMVRNERKKFGVLRSY